jgi:formylglycine-generating enzyme required for sulfatase activity
MSSNVEKWCLNEYDNPQRINLSGSARRAVRGGSWGDVVDGARASCRAHYVAGYRRSNLGLRVVRSSPGLS